MNYLLSRPNTVRLLAVVLTVLLAVVGFSLPALAADPAPEPTATEQLTAAEAEPSESELPETELPEAQQAETGMPEREQPETEQPETELPETGQPETEQSQTEELLIEGGSDEASGEPEKFARASTFAVAATGVTVSPTTLLDGGDTVTISGSLPAQIVHDAGATSGTPATTGIYLMYCVEGATPPGTQAGRLTGAACNSSAQQYLVAASGPAGGTVAGSVSEGVWTFSTTMTLPASFGTHTCRVATGGGEQCGVFLRLYHGFSASNLADPYAYDQFVPVTFAPAAGISVSPATHLSDGQSVTVTGGFPASVIQDAGASSGTAATTGVYVMYCAEGTTAPGTAGGRLTGAACNSSAQQYLVAAAGPAGGTVVGSVANDWWTFSATIAVPDSFGVHECLSTANDAEQCGVFVRLYHGFNAGNLANPYVYDQFAPVTFAPPAGITVTPSQNLADGATVTVSGELPASIVQDRGAASGTSAVTGVYVMYCAEGTTAPGTAGGRLTGAACHSPVQQYLVAATGPAGGTVAGTVDNGWWSFSTTLDLPDSFGVHECLSTADDAEQCGVFVRLYHGFNAGNLANPYVYDQFVPVTFAPSVGITVSPATDLEDGDTVTVRGTFPAEVIRDAGATSGTAATTGVYLMYCAEGTTAPGSAGGRLTGAACDSSVQQYLVAASGLAGGTVEGSVDDGWWSFEVEMDVPGSFGAHECLSTADDAEQCGVFVRLYHGFTAGNLANPYVYDQFAPVTFATPETTDPGTDPGPGTPEAPARVALSVTPSTINPTVTNTITVSGSGYTGPGAANGVYVSLGQSSQWQPGQVPGAGGWVRSLHIPASQLSAGSFSTTISLPAGTLELGQSYGVATFAAHGLAVTNRTLDAWAPITLSTTAAATAASTNQPAANPPADEGVETESDEFVEGGVSTFTASGFAPNEGGILAVIYSEPTVLADDLTADAGGAVTWTGTLPLGLTGEHTFTFQGSVDKGIVIDIAAAEEVGCPVEGAELHWGFKESFRAYIDGSIANGEWTTADGASYETPLFSWLNGAGGYDAASGDTDLAFTGSVRFTGHGGVLDTTIANPRVVIDGERAVLLLDVSGTTQDGATISATGVEFVELDLSAAEAGGGGDLVAFSGIPATLTAAGADAFGTYETGEAFDTIDLRITIDPACIEPAVAVDEPGAEVETASDAPPLPWALLAVLVALVLATAAVIVVRRARRA